MNNEKLLKTGQVAEVLNVHRNTVIDWTKRGILSPDHTNEKGYNFYSFKTVIDFSKTAQNLLENSSNCTKSPTIKNQTAQNLQKCLKNSSIKSMYIKVHFDEHISSQKIIKVSGKRAIEINNELIRLDKSLPEYHFNEVIKLMSVLKLAELSEEYKTSFKKDKSLQTFFRLDSDLPDDFIDSPFDPIDALILNAIYSFIRDGHKFFTPRRLLRHLFGNVHDNFQKEPVEQIKQRIERLRCTKITYDLRDALGNVAHIKINGVPHRLLGMNEMLLDLTILPLESIPFKKPFWAYQINKTPPLFQYAEDVNQITAWSAKYMAVPCRKTIQNALLINYFLTKFALMKNKGNKFFNHGILFQSIFEDLQLDVSSRDKKKRIIDNIRKMFDFWLKIHLIHSYEFQKQGQAFYKIAFSINQKAEV